ncbi:MAG: peptidylprolyl isomerase [Magnetococcales bacterium]|nr:peptidylprolyl isomerase [Magnetococcales bacterium]
MVKSREVDLYFSKHKESLKRLCIARIVCKNREEADKIYETVCVDNERFAPLARQYSMEHNSRIAGGHLGCIGRGVLPEDIEQDLFASKVGTIKGPYQQNGYWAIYLIEEILNNSLTNATRNNISDQLFAEWLREKVLLIKNKEKNQENKYV